MLEENARPLVQKGGKKGLVNILKRLSRWLSGNLPANARDLGFCSLGWEDPLE